MTNGDKSDTLKEIVATATDLDFLKTCREFKFGKLEVTVKNGEPVMSRELERHHKHDNHN